uniref:peptide-methionine (S)-S-oxide reductase n=1 Tax=Amphora coffeiformis TaxID=265554 RepID=A0A7S3LF23_9STRA|mmetsp:Transcript_8237/g.15684  ORF Transcript_8237/g.15684 Transcript_8237/m.15684 type:complete len:386 (+) Transcript_8237:154-1311(+)
MWSIPCLGLVVGLIGLPSSSGWALRPVRLPTKTTSRRILPTRLASTTQNEEDTKQSASLKPTKGSVVKIACRLQPEGDFVPEPLIDGIVLHEEDSTVDLHFMLGWGNYLPGLHDLILEDPMEVGETRSGVSVDAGWGDVNPNLIATISFQDSGMNPSQIKVGSQLWLQAQNLACSVTAVTDTTFTIDANPPLAGASYQATVTLKAVEEGPVVGPYTTKETSQSKYEVCTFALGCFWGGELAFMRVPGVVGTAVGYTQGDVKDPTYQEVCSGTTGHTEAILVIYDPTKATYETLVDVAMDRLGENKYLLNQVGNDKGTQYRHGVYYHTPAQKEIAEKVLKSFGADCVTECKAATKFYFAEDYHQQYLLKSGQSARKGDTTVIRCYG